MKKRIVTVCLLLAAALLLGGCAVQTVDQLYRLPRRSEAYNDLQSAIDGAMTGMEFSAPLTGENQQTVQMADLDGDGEQEYLLFARGTSERPLRILIFRNQDGTYVHTDTVESNGSAFDQVEYVQMDEKGGVELIVGRRVSDQVLRSVSVYSFGNGEAEQLVTANYAKFLTTDLDDDGYSELFVLRPGQDETERGVAELYAMRDGTIERSNEVNMSEPAGQLKRILVGKLHDGETAVYVASTVDDATIITDVYALAESRLVNVTFSNESGTSIQTLRNYYVYADDVDNDGVVELPDQITIVPLDEELNTDRHNLIRWYAMTLDGGEVDKMYTYHNFVGGWYLELEGDLAARITVLRQGNHYEFYIWNPEGTNTRKLFTVYTLTGQNREEQAASENRFVVLRTESVVYAASLEADAGDYGFTQTRILESFHLIYQDWKTGET